MPCFEVWRQFAKAGVEVWPHTVFWAMSQVLVSASMNWSVASPHEQIKILLSFARAAKEVKQLQHTTVHLILVFVSENDWFSLTSSLVVLSAFN